MWNYSLKQINLSTKLNLTFFQVSYSTVKEESSYLVQPWLFFIKFAQNLMTWYKINYHGYKQVLLFFRLHLLRWGPEQNGAGQESAHRRQVNQK